MSEEITKEIEDFLVNLNSEIDILCCVDIEEIDLDNPYDSIYQMIDENDGFSGEIIYYANAMKYLTENDTSLQESLTIADEYGYKCKNLNSEILASLLCSQNIRDDFYDSKDDIEEFFDEIRLKIEQGESEDDDED